jgi:hypothetical protein
MSCFFYAASSIPGTRAYNPDNTWPPNIIDYCATSICGTVATWTSLDLFAVPMIISGKSLYLTTQDKSPFWIDIDLSICMYMHVYMCMYVYVCTFVVLSDYNCIG